MISFSLQETTERLSPFIGGAATADAQLHRVRRAALLRRLRLSARLSGATLDVDISLHARIGRRIRVSVAPGSANVLRIGDWTTIDDDVTILLKGGTVVIGDWCELCRGVVLNAAGSLELAGQDRLSVGTVVHCAARVQLAEKVTTGEYVSIVDSSHYFTEPDTNLLYNLATGGIEVGYNSWLCAKATLTRNAKVGRHCIVAANSVVVGAVPDCHLASGVPAVVRPLSLPWRDASDPPAG